MASATKKTVWFAFVANFVIAVAKGVGGLLTGSSALLAEAAHSVADTTNQVLLLLSLKLGKRPPDEEHPFGHGKERFFWSFVVAVSIFVAGGVFSIGEGVLSLLEGGGGSQSYLVAYVVLAVALGAELVALAKATMQVRDEARRERIGFVAQLRRSRDPTVKVAFSEDLAAVLGVVIALAGIGYAQATGHHAADAVAAIVIGVLLTVVAFVLARDVKDLLIGQAATRDDRQRLRETIRARPEVNDVVELLTMHMGPEDVLVAARVDFGDAAASRLEEVAHELERELRAAVPTVSHVFLDPTPPWAGASEAAITRGHEGARHRRHGQGREGDRGPPAG